MRKPCIILITLSLLSSCSSYKPVLDQNAKYFASSAEEQKQDIATCKKQAEDYLDKIKAEKAMREAGRSSVIGGVIGTIFGVISGGNLRSVLGGTAIGAGAGGALGGLSVAGEDHVTPDQIKQRYISNCLAQKGYSVIGWY